MHVGPAPSVSVGFLFGADWELVTSLFCSVLLGIILCPSLNCHR